MQTDRMGRYFPLILLGLTVFGLLLRMWGIDARGITHPEIYVPGIQLVEGISEPPLRPDFWSALSWHFHDEPHPVGWYLAMMGWADVFGTSQFALRLPSALFGAGAVFAIGLLGRRIWGVQAGLLAAALLSMHGFHIFWSQAARMYTAGAFFAILSAYLLILLMDRDKRSPWLELSYVAACVAGIQSVEFFWPILLVQVVWVALLANVPSPAGTMFKFRNPFSMGPRLVQVQSLILMLSVPSLAHSVYRARNGAAEAPTPEFLPEYLTFGFLFSNDDFSPTRMALPLVASVILAAMALGLIMLSLRAKPLPSTRTACGPQGLATWIVLLTLSGSFLTMVYIGMIANRRNSVLLAMSILPIMAFLLPALVALVQSSLTARLPRFENWRKVTSPGPMLILAYAVAFPVLIFLLSFKLTLLAPRAWMVFLPFILVASSAGTTNLLNTRPALGKVLIALLFVLFAASVPYSWKVPNSPRDYQALARAVEGAMQPSDLFFVQKNSWVDTPFFYYLPDANYVAEDWSAAAANTPDARIWVFGWPADRADEDPRFEAVANYEHIQQISIPNATADLFERNP